VTVEVRRERCDGCHGSGYGAGSGKAAVGLCMVCHGAGWIASDRTIEMELPPDVRDGMEVHVDKAGSMRWDGQREDLIYVVRVDRTWDRLDSNRA